MSEQVITCPRCAGACFALTLTQETNVAKHDCDLKHYMSLECQRCCKQVLQFVVDLTPEFERS
jgi:hypothetical protein